MTLSAMADFVGVLELIPAGCEKTGRCRLGQNFGFIDQSGTGWQARKGLVTDGASIPSWARPLVGQPFEKSFIKAAVIHDHYCDRHVRKWRQTHRVFYEALRASNVPKGKAGIMYFAVLVGGPKWVKLIKGKKCGLGDTCVFQLDVASTIPNAQLTIDETGGLVAARPPEFDSARFAAAMATNTPELEAAGDSLTPEQVEKFAADAMAGDFFFENGDEIGTTLDVKVEVR
jgi:hypothetical protein